MTDFEWLQFVDTGYNIDYLPTNAHLVIEKGDYIYYANIDDKGVLRRYDTTDETEVEIEDIGTIDISGMLKSSNTIYFVGCNNLNRVEVWYVNSFEGTEFGTQIGNDITTGHSTTSYADIVSHSGSLYIFAAGSNAAPPWYTLLAYKWVEPNWVLQDTLTISNDIIGYMLVIGTDGYILQAESTVAAQMLHYDFTADAFSAAVQIEATGYDIVRDQGGLAYDGSDYIYLILKKDADSKRYLYKYQISIDTPTEVGEYDIILMLDRNCSETAPYEYEKAFHRTSSYIYQINKGYDYLLKLQDLELTGGATIKAITDKYLIDSDKNVYEYTDCIDDMTNPIINSKIYGKRTCRFEYEKYLSSDQVIQFYQNSSGTYTKIFEGKIQVPKYDNRRAVYRYSLTDPAVNDLNRKIDHTSAAEDIATFVIDSINDNCNWLYADATSCPATGVNLVVSDFIFDQTELYILLHTMAIAANGYWWYEPDGYTYFRKWSAKPASGDTFSQDTNDMFPPTFQKTQFQYNTWDILGGINPATGEPFVSNTTDDAHIREFGELVWNGRKAFPEARTQNALDVIAAGLEAWQGAQDLPSTAEFYMRNKYYYALGRSASVQFNVNPNSPIGSATTMLVAATELELISKKSKATFTENIISKRGK